MTNPTDPATVAALEIYNRIGFGGNVRTNGDDAGFVDGRHIRHVQDIIRAAYAETTRRAQAADKLTEALTKWIAEFPDTDASYCLLAHGAAIFHLREEIDLFLAAYRATATPAGETEG